MRRRRFLSYIWLCRAERRLGQSAVAQLEHSRPGDSGRDVSNDPACAGRSRRVDVVCLAVVTTGEGIWVSDQIFSALPSGQREWWTLIDALSSTDDRAERHFLEMKSELNLNENSGRAKVAKFVLAAANRDPGRAAPYFGGRAVMILGAAKDVVTGIPGFEAHELERAVQKFTGIPGPSWDFVRVPVSDDRDVIAVIVAPPGGRVWPCLKDGDGLSDGAIYLRADGETRVAKGGEVNVMLERVQQVAAGTAEFEVSVFGCAYRIVAADEVLQEFLSDQKERLLQAYRRHRNKARPEQVSHQMMSHLAAGLQLPERRSYEEYVEQIEGWEDEVAQTWPALLDHIAGCAGSGISLRIGNLSNAFTEDVLVEIYFEGPVEAIDAEDNDALAPAAQLPSPPAAWGSKEASLFPAHNWVLPDTAFFPSRSSVHHGVSFENGGSTTLQLELPVLRPHATHNSEDDEVVLVVRDADLGEITGRWRITARGHHRVYEGELRVPVKTADVTDALRSTLLATEGGAQD